MTRIPFYCRSLKFSGLSVVAASFALAFSVAKADYPEHTINYVIPFAPGGESDITARFQEEFFEQCADDGGSLAIQYKAGAGGATGWAQLNRMPADGYTIMGTNLPHIILQPMDKDVGYKTEDLQNIYWFHYTPDALLVPAESDIDTLQDFIDKAKENPGSITLGGTGLQSGNHLAQVRFDQLAGITTSYIPFKGTGAVNTALLGSQVDGSWGYGNVKLQFEDQVKCLAIATEERLPNIDCPTFKELGFDLTGGVYRGIAVPKDTPEEIQLKLADIIEKINHNPDFVKKMEDGGFVLVNIGPDKMDEFMAEQTKALEKAAKEMGIK